MLMKKVFSAILVSALLVASVPCFAQEDIAIDKGVGDVIVIPYDKVMTPTVSFSFASDTFHNGPTFKGVGGGSSTFYSGAQVDLMVDMNNDDYGGTVTFLSNLELKAEAYDHQVFNFGNQFLHVWKVYSEMNFKHVNPALNSPILDIGFKEGVLTSWSPSECTLGETMTLQDSQSADLSIYMNANTLLRGIGVPEVTLYDSKDLAFTFTNVRAVDDNGNMEKLVNLDEKGNFKDDWIAEGSFSASAAIEKWWGYVK